MEKQTNSIFYEPSGEINEFGGGAAKRSFQIYELLKKNFSVLETKKVKFVFSSRFERYCKGLQFINYSQSAIKSISNIASAGYLYTNISKVVDENPNVKCLIWESSINDFYLKPLMFKKKGIKLISFPHNLESLVPGQNSSLSGKKAPFWLNEEISLLRNCNHVFTISKEEQWLLKLHGVDCDYFPYFPSVNASLQLNKIRNYRKTNVSENFFLVFGSYFYNPIKEGIIELLKHVITNNIQVNIKIAGYQSEQLRTVFDYIPSNIEIIGTASDSKLEELYNTCKGIIINQRASSGALTKVPELQLAGIPIIINELSTRSNYFSKGCYVFTSIQGIEPLLGLHEYEIPDIPLQAAQYEKLVIDKIKEII